MKKFGIAAAAILVLSGCSGGGDSAPSTGASTSPVVGDWSAPCAGTVFSESYSFEGDGRFEASSFTESVSGVYTYQENSSVRHSLNVVVTNDNGLGDCYGNSTDDTGGSFEFFVEFPGTDAMLWYSAATGGELVATLTRQ